MSYLVPLSSGALEASVTSGSAVTLASALDTSQDLGVALYTFSADVDVWILQSNAGTAATTSAGSMFVPAQTQITIDGNMGSHLSCIADSSSGKSSIVPVVIVH